MASLPNITVAEGGAPDSTESLPSQHQTRKQEPEKLGFFDLPREVRDRIYDYAVADVQFGEGHTLAYKSDKCFNCPWA